MLPPIHSNTIHGGTTPRHYGTYTLALALLLRCFLYIQKQFGEDGAGQSIFYTLRINEVVIELYELYAKANNQLPRCTNAACATRIAADNPHQSPATPSATSASRKSSCHSSTPHYSMKLTTRFDG